MQDFFFGLEVIVDIASRHACGLHNVRKRGVVITLVIEETVCRLDDALAGSFAFLGHGERIGQKVKKRYGVPALIVRSSSMFPGAPGSASSFSSEAANP
jgi:hypothetical protein